MGKNAASLFLLAGLGLALAACTDKSKTLYDVDPNAFPSDYQHEIFVTLTKVLDDPTGVRDAGITDPVLGPVGKEQRYIVCVRANARNANRHYEGVKGRIAYFYGGHLNQLVEDSNGQCAKAPYKPWPELTNYCLAKKCT